MGYPISMADDELGALRDFLANDELAQAVAEANDETAVVLLLKSCPNRLLALMLWRNRTGADLKTVVDAVAEIEKRHNLSS